MNVKKYWRLIIRYNFGEFSRKAVKQAKNKAEDRRIERYRYDSDSVSIPDGTEIKPGDENAKQFLSRYNNWLRGYDD
ncbi:hypothetical protein AAFF39_03360 [Lactococcus garvieae]